MSIQTEINRITQLRDEQTSLLSTQAVTIDDIKLALQDKCAGEVINLQEKTVTPTKSVQTVTPDSDYNGLSKVTVNAIPSDYINPSGTLNITTNGTHNVKNYASASVNVPSEDLTSELNTYEDYLSTQETTIDDIINALQNKSEGTGKDTIEGLMKRTIKIFSSDTLTSVGAYACHSCTSLTSVNLSKAISLGISAFNNCTAMTSFEAPLLESFTTQSFYACNALTSLNFPKLKTIGSQGARNCKKLARVDLGVVTSIGALSFDDCSLLETCIIRTETVPTLVNASAFTGTLIASGTGYIYVLDTLVDSYKSASNWSTYASQIKPLSELGA